MSFDRAKSIEELFGTRKHLFDATFEGYCLVFETRNKYCNLEIHPCLEEQKHQHQKKPILRVDKADFIKKHNKSEWEKLTKDENKEWKKLENDENKEWTRNMNNLFNDFEKAKVDYKILTNDITRNYIIVLISVKEEKVEDWIAARDIDIPIDPDESIHAGRKSKLSFPLAENTKFPNEVKAEKLKPGQYVEPKKWNNIYIGFEKQLKEVSIDDEKFNIYQKCNDPKDYGIKHTRHKDSVIPHALYLRTVYDILVNDQELNGAGYIVETLLNDRRYPLVKFFAIHQEEHDIKHDLKLKCIGPRFNSDGKNQKFVNSIRNYYGEEIGFYFAFLVHYTLWLYPLAIVGAIWFAFEYTRYQTEMEDNLATHGSIVFVLFVISWATLMIANWYKRQWSLRYMWGMLRYRNTEIPRPQFNGKYIISETNGMEVETYKYKYCRYVKMFFSLIVEFIGVCIVITLTVWIWSLQIYYYTQTDDADAVSHDDTFLSSRNIAIMIGMVNSAQIILCNKIFTKIAIKLNNWEGHRLQADYYNNLVIKRISFIVINSFYSLFYIAFIDQRSEYEDDVQRLQALRFQLIILFCMAVVVQNCLEMLFPKFKRFCFKCCSGKNKEEIKEKDMNGAIYSEVERESDSSDPDDDDDDVDNDDAKSKAKAYTAKMLKDINNQMELGPAPPVLDNTAEIIVLHGYVTLFVVVFPLMPLLAVINVLIELAVDKYILLNTQRPVPAAASGIGVWSTVLSIFNVVSIFSNLAIITFRTELVVEMLYMFESFFSEIDAIYWTNEDMQENLLVFYFVTCILVIAFIVCLKLCTSEKYVSTIKAIARQETCQRELVHLEAKENENI